MAKKERARDAGRKTEGEESEESVPEIDVGGLLKATGLGGLLNGMSNLLEKAGELAEKGEQLGKTGEFRVGGIPPGVRGAKNLRGVYGFTVRTLADGAPKVETFGNIKKTPKGPIVEEMREPIVDIFDEGDTIKVIAELPGVEEGDVHTEVKGDILRLSAQGKERKYSKEILLPTIVDEEAVKSTYGNGILEIELLKKENANAQHEDSEDEGS